jgi:WD40 repeat protein
MKLKAANYDTSFGEQGLVSIVSPGNESNEMAGLTLDNQGRTIIYGTYQHGTPSRFRTGVCRLTDNGNPDLEFGSDGAGFTTAPERNDGPGVDGLDYNINDELFIVTIADENLTLLRYDQNGRFPKAFSIDSASKGRTSRLLVMDDDKLIISGIVDQGVMLYRRNADGTADENFGERGKKHVLTDSAYVNILKIISDSTKDHFFLVGFAGNDGIVAKFDAEGNLDDSFATGGVFVIRTETSANSTCINAIRLANGNIIILYNTFYDNAPACFLTCLNREGEPEPSFNSGQALRLIGNVAESISLASGGEFAVAHRSLTAGNYVSLFLPSGAPYPDFGVEGNFMLGLIPGIVKDVIIHSDKRITVGFSNPPQTKLARLTY